MGNRVLRPAAQGRVLSRTPGSRVIPVPAPDHERRDRRAAGATGPARFDEVAEAHMTTMDLVAYIQAQLRRFDPAVTGPDFVLATDASKCTVVADERLLEQVVANPLSNAIKCSGDCPRIDVSIAAGGGAAVLRVRDYGIGIAADEIPKLFARFFRTSSARHLPGTGIGLNLVNELVATHGGTIAVDSELGRGTTFTVTLPHRPAAATPWPPTGAAAISATTVRRHPPP
ncbi:MAG: ATP-binding protein [Alphaproteobacteria bacterium]|nr:ATP-binding protein [Alphaproteobacteria bacterium]